MVAGSDPARKPCGCGSWPQRNRIIDGIEQRTGLSADIVRTGLAVVVPVLIHHLVASNHMTASGEPTGPQPESGGLLQSLLRHIL